MILYHNTLASNLKSILRYGLRPNAIGIVHLSPSPYAFKPIEKGEAILAVETGVWHLSAFEDCEKWEVLCWPGWVERALGCNYKKRNRNIAPENIQVFELASDVSNKAL